MVELNIGYVIGTAVLTASAAGGVSGVVSYLSFRGMFNEYKADTERRLTCLESDSEKYVTIPLCDKAHNRNDKEHDEIFGRLRHVEAEK